MEETFNAKGIDVETIQAELDRLWPEVLLNPDTRSAIRSSGININQLAQLPGKPIQLKHKPEQGLDPIVTVLVIEFAPVAADILRDIWQHFLLPRLRQKFGEDVLEKSSE